MSSAEAPHALATALALAAGYQNFDPVAKLIDPVAASHVQYVYDHERGLEKSPYTYAPDAFLWNLINTARSGKSLESLLKLSTAYPNYVAAVWLAAQPGGLAVLRNISSSDLWGD